MCLPISTCPHLPRKLLDHYLNDQEASEQEVAEPPAKKVKAYEHVIFRKKATEEDNKTQEPLQLTGTKLLGFSQPKLLETTVIDHIEIVEFDKPKNGKANRKVKEELPEPEEAIEEEQSE